MPFELLFFFFSFVDYREKDVVKSWRTYKIYNLQYVSLYILKAYGDDRLSISTQRNILLSDAALKACEICEGVLNCLRCFS